MCGFAPVGAGAPTDPSGRNITLPPDTTWDEVMLHAISLAVGTASSMTQIIVAIVVTVLIGIMS
jgi:hypothetical protein